MFDSKCYDLAAHFLPERCSEARKVELAQLIQDTIEDSCSMYCEDCQERLPVKGEDLCPDCRDNRAEAAYERSLGECFRGGEAAGYLADQQEQARRLK